MVFRSGLFSLSFYLFLLSLHILHTLSHSSYSVNVTTVIAIITHRAIVRLSLQSFCYEGHICYLCKQQICFLVGTTDTNQSIRLFSRFVRNLLFNFSVQFIVLHFFNQFI